MKYIILFLTAFSLTTLGLIIVLVVGTFGAELGLWLGLDIGAASVLGWGLMASVTGGVLAVLSNK